MDTEKQKIKDRFGVPQIPGPLYHSRQRIINSYLERMHLPKGTLLDVGCGSGFISQYFHQNGYKVVGIDLAEERIEHAKSLFGKDIRFICTDLMEYVPKRKFDVVFSSVSLMYLPDYKKAIRKMTQLLRENGSIVLVEPSRNYFVLTLKRTWVGKLLVHLKHALFGKPRPLPRGNRFTYNQLKNEFERNGFEITAYFGTLHAISVFSRLLWLSPLWVFIESIPKPNCIKEYGSVLIVEAKRRRFT